MIDLLSNFGRAAFGVLGLAVFLWARKRDSVPNWFWCLFWLATRVGAGVLLFAVLGLPAPTDATSTYILQARGALAGQLPYRDFDSSFAPLFPIVLSSFVRVWNSAIVFVVVAILAEGLTLVCWLAFGPRVFPARAAHLGLAACVCSPLLFNTAIMGQDEVGVALLLSLLVIILHHERWLAGAIGSALMLLTTKFTSLLFLPFLAWRSGRLFTFAAVVAAVVGPVYAWYAQVGADIFVPLRFEGGLFTNGNVFFLASYFGSFYVSDPAFGRISLLGLITLLAVLFMYFIRFRRPDTSNLATALVVAQLIFLLLFKKSYHTYLVMVMPLLCFQLATRRPAALPWLLVLATMSVIQQSLFFRQLGFADLSAWHWATAPWSQRLFVVADAGMVAGYAAITALLLGSAPESSKVPIASS